MKADTITGGEQRPPPEASAVNLKSLAEEKYSASDFKEALKVAKKAHRLDPTLDGLRQMITALRILRASPSDHYRILDIEPFSHINSIKKKYKSLALLLHPDKSSSSSSPFFSGSVEAFKRVGDAFRVLSDGDRRKEYDGKLRVQIEAAEGRRGEDGAVETFWTACNTCRLFHEFDRRYLGQRLLCPGCRKSFLAIEVNAEDGDAAAAADAGGDGSVISKFRTGKRSSRSRSKSSVDHNMKVPATAKNSRYSSSKMGRSSKRKRRELTLKQMQAACLSEAGRVKKKKREPTLKEMQEEALRMKTKSNPVKVNREALENSRSKSRETNLRVMELSDDGDGSLNVMAVEDSDFYDFDKDRMEKSFRKGEVWAIYDDDDGMPRHYGLIEEVFSRNPFELKMSWLDLQNNEEESITPWEQMGFHVSCGRFKLGKKVNIDSVNLFSHVVCCERAAKEVYRIYPKKGSVWALYSERTISEGEERCYDIVVVLTSYSELYGLSLGYLEKVVGFKTIFQRREIGVHAIRWLEKVHLQLFSHQIPSRNLVGEEGLNLPNECWELDPASLPAVLLCTNGGQ